MATVVVVVLSLSLCCRCRRLSIVDCHSMFATTTTAAAAVSMSSKKLSPCRSLFLLSSSAAAAIFFSPLSPFVGENTPKHLQSARLPCPHRSPVLVLVLLLFVMFMFPVIAAIVSKQSDRLKGYLALALFPSSIPCLCLVH